MKKLLITTVLVITMMLVPAKSLAHCTSHFNSFFSHPLIFHLNLNNELYTFPNHACYVCLDYNWEYIGELGGFWLFRCNTCESVTSVKIERN